MALSEYASVGFEIGFHCADNLDHADLVGRDLETIATVGAAHGFE